MITEIVIIVMLLYISLIGVSYFKGTDKEVLIDRDDSYALKGLAAFFVIAAHTYLGGTYTIISGLNGVPFKAIGSILAQLGGIGVLIFFYLSGYGIEEGYGNKEIDKQFIINRLKKVYFPYLYIKFVLLFGETVVGLYDVSVLPKKIIDICCIEDWFVQVIMIEYLFYFMVGRFDLKRKLLLLFVLNAFIGAIFVFMRLPSRYYNSMWLFVIGVASSLYQDMILDVIKEKNIIIILGSMATFIGFGAIFAMNKGAMWCEICKIIAGVALIVLLVSTMQYVKLGSPILKWGGKKSLYIYIVHVSIMGFFCNMERIEMALCFIVLSLVVTVVLDLLKTRVIRQTSILRRL